MSTHWQHWIGMENVTQLGWTLLHFVWQGMLIGLLHALIRLLTVRASSSVRYRLAGVLLLLCPAAPVGTWFMLAPPPASAVMQPPQTNTESAPLIAAAEVKSVSVQPGSEAPVANSLAARMSEPTPVVSAPWLSRLEAALPGVVMLWFAGVLLLSARLGLGWQVVRRLRAQSQALEQGIWRRRAEAVAQRLGVTTRVHWLVSSSVDSPMTMGWWRPAIVLPASLLSGLPRDQVEMILAHELAHVRRGDYLIHAVQCCIETVLFFHPVVWWIGRDLRVLREECCDDLAVSKGDATVLARALLNLEEARIGAPLLAQAAHGTGILPRVRRLLQPQVARSPAPRWIAGLGSGLLCLLLVTLAARQAWAANEIVVKPGESIQAAIDQAPDGATIRLEAGLFAERITLSKPVTLLGAGWKKTILKPDRLEPGVEPGSRDEAMKRYQAASTDDERRRIYREISDRIDRSTLTIDKAKGVTVRGLRIQGIAPATEQETNKVAALARVRESEATIVDCAIVGPYGTGLVVMVGSKLHLQDSLVAGLWGTGVSIVPGNPGEGAPPSVTMTGCDVRNCYHRCITIARQCNDVRIERCRISGSAWHGIRYDDASPVIEHNLIFANARSGIYASGATKAKVRGNVMFANEMNAVSCWFANEDEFSGNTIVANRREGVSVLGASKPVFKNNLIALNPTGMMLGMVSGNGTSAKTMGQAVREKNVFWQNHIPINEGAPGKPLTGTDREVDPQFTNVKEQNYALLASSPLRAEAIGVADMPVPASPWPLQPEEKQIIPALDTRDYNLWQMPGKPVPVETIQIAQINRAQETAAAWVKDALQIEDATKRATAIEAIRAALAGKESADQLAGLVALDRISVVEFDAAPFRPLVLPLMEHENQWVNMQACRVLQRCGFQPDDHARLLKLAEKKDRVVQQRIIPFLLATAPKPLDEATEKAVLAALSPGVIDSLRTLGTEDTYRQTMRSLGEVDLPTSIKARLIELCADKTVVIYRLAFFYALAPQKQKTEADISAIAKFLVHEDVKEIVPRALWALGVGISGGQKSQGVAVLTDFIKARADSALRLHAVKALVPNITATHLPFCESQLTRPGLGNEERKLYEQLVARLKKVR